MAEINKENATTDVPEPDHSGLPILPLGEKTGETGTPELNFEDISERATAVALEKSKKFIEERITKENIPKQIDDLKARIEKTEDKQINIIETIGIFVALFTFISIDFQVFRSYRNYLAISGLSLIFLGSIFLFIIVFDFFILQNQANVKTKKVSKNSKYKIGFTMLSILLIVSGIFLFSKSPNEGIQDKEDVIRGQVYELLKNDIDNQTKELSENNENNKNSIDDLKDNIESIKKCIRNFGFTYRCF